MKPCRVVVELSPSRLDVTVLRAGAPAETRSTRFDRVEWPTNLADALRELEAPLQALVQELKVAGAAATVIYSTPGSVCSVTSCAANAGLGNAEQAATLALSNIADFPLDGSPHDTSVVLLEKPAKADANAPLNVPQMHVLSAADSELRASAIAEVIKNAGLRLERLVPVDAVMLQHAVSLATGATTSADMQTAVLWLGEHSSVLAVGSPGRLAFVRSVSAGVESLAEALTRPIRPLAELGDTAQQITLTRSQARALLASAGVPAPDQRFADYPSITGASILPHLQPILQRLAIEIKQSLRFGIAENARQKVQFRVAGVGAGIANLSDVLARQAALTTAQIPPERASSFAPIRPHECLDLAGRSGINLLPSSLRVSMSVGRMRKALFAGAALAAALVAGEFTLTRVELHHERAKLASLAAKTASLEASTRDRENTLARRNQLTTIESRMRETLPDAPPWPVMLTLLANETPTPMRLTDLELTTVDGAGKVNARGYILYADAADPAGLINRYITSLSSIPVVSSARLGATSRGGSRGSDIQSFEIQINVLPLPPDALSPESLAHAETTQEAPR